MVLDDSYPEEFGKDNGLEVYDKVWVDLASQISMAIPQTFRV